MESSPAVRSSSARAQRPSTLDRVYVDVSTLQVMADHGAEIFDRQATVQPRRQTRSSGVAAEVEALAQVFRVRPPVQFVVTRATLRRVSDRGWRNYRQWMSHLEENWLQPDSVPEAAPSIVLSQSRFDGVSVRDRRIVQAALEYGCDAAVVMERRLPGSTAFIRHSTGLQLLQPSSFLAQLGPVIWRERRRALAAQGAGALAQVVPIAGGHRS